MSLRDTNCPGCGHKMNRHALELGCEANWGPYQRGTSTREGCECPLTLAEQHNPPRGRDA